MKLTLCKAPTRETRPDRYTRNPVPYSLRQVGSLTSPADYIKLKMQKTEPTIYCPYPRRLEHLTICRCHWSLQRQQVLLCYFKTLSVGPVQGWNPRPPPQQFSTQPTKLTDRREMNFKKQEMKLTRIKQSYGTALIYIWRCELVLHGTKCRTKRLDFKFHL